MRGTAAILVCLVSLHYLTIIDAYTARFTSENGMPGREHEDKHSQRSAAVKRSLPKTMRQEPDYNWEDYGGIPNIPGYMYRDYFQGMDTYEYDDWDEPVGPRYQSARKSAVAKRSLSASPDQTMRQYHYYYDDWEHYGGIPNIPGYIDRDDSIDADTGADVDKNSFSKTLQRLLSPVVDAVRQLWGRLSGKPLESVGSGVEDTKREDVRNGPLRKGAMENRNEKDREAADQKNLNIGNALNYLTDLAKKALDFAYGVIDKIDVSKLTEETKKLKQAVLDALKKARDAIEQLLGEVARGVGSNSARRTRSVGKRTNARDALESYLTSLKSLKRSKSRHSLRRSMKGNTSARASDMTALMDLMTEMEDCIRKIPATNTSLLGVKCIVLPLVRVLASPKPGGAYGLATSADSGVRSDAIESPDNLRRLNFPWGSIFLIPVYNGQRPDDKPMVPHYSDQEFDNVTTTTEPPTTTTTTTTSTTEALPIVINDESDTMVRSGSKYRSKYDNGF